MTVNEIAQWLNQESIQRNTPFSKIQDIRSNHDIKPRTRKPFLNRLDFNDYRYHSGGRNEFQFNFGVDQIKGKEVFRYGMAFPIKEDRNLTDVEGTFLNGIANFNSYLKSNQAYFNGLKMWHYFNDELHGFQEQVKKIPLNIFKTSNFIFVGKYVEKPISQLNKKDLELVLKTFDYLVPLYEEVQFGKVVVEDRYARLTYNTKGWVQPSGRLGKSTHQNTHEGRFGYGHEEWFLDTSKLIDGYSYGFLEPIRKKQNSYTGNNYNVWLYAIDGMSGVRYWVGKVADLEVVSSQESKRIKKIYQSNGWYDQMLSQLKSAVPEIEDFSNWESLSFFNVRYKPENLHVEETYFHLPVDHPIYNVSRYTFGRLTSDFLDFETAIDQKGFEFLPGSEVAELDEGVKKKKTIRRPKEIEIVYLHDAISKILRRSLGKKYGNKNVVAEHPSGVGKNRIDMVVNLGDSKFAFYEIKTYNSIKACIREAIGQLFEYAFWTEQQNAQELIIVSQKKGNLEHVRLYMTHLRRMYNLPLYYQSIDLASGELSEKI